LPFRLETVEFSASGGYSKLFRYIIIVINF
jgi:hypothetical protein